MFSEMKPLPFSSLRFLTALGCLLFVGQTLGLGQAPEAHDARPQSDVDAHTIILSPGRPRPPAFLYTSSSRAVVRISEKEVQQTIDLKIRVVQGDRSRGESVSLGLGGTGDVKNVDGEAILSWAVRTVGGAKFLDLQLKPTEDPKIDETIDEISAVLRIVSQHSALPSTVELAHLMPGKSLGLDAQLKIQYESGVHGKVLSADGFAPLVSSEHIPQMHTSTGGRLELLLTRSNTRAPSIEWTDATLQGAFDSEGKSLSFQFRGTANVSVTGARLQVLSGAVAISQLPENQDYQLVLRDGEVAPFYELVFRKEGSYPIELSFVSKIHADSSPWLGVDFHVAASAVVPVTIRGLATDIEFAREPNSMVPLLVEENWKGFIPGTGHVVLKWKNARSSAEGKSFFTTTATIETTVGPGLVRQEHRIQYQILQGQLKSLDVRLVGPGEILSVEGESIYAWKVQGEGNDRRLEIALSQPISTNSPLIVRSQTPFGAFPVRVEGLSVQPQGAIRHSGHLRVANAGSVSIEVTSLRGLTQLAPEQFPGEAIQSRQLFVYRLPSEDYGFAIAADRVQPEVSVSQVVIYQLSESDRVVLAEIELDIREAAIREWQLNLPADYSIVSVTGANVADYVAKSESAEGRRDLKILFNQEVQGRQLVGLRLEKNEVAATGPWTLPPILFPEAKAVRGDIGIVAAPGFRATVGTTELLAEKPLSYFPRPVVNLQHAFRIREPGWKGTMQMEKLERSIQSDVFHLISLSQGTIYSSALINYLVTGAPVSELKLAAPASLGNVTVDGQDVRTWRRVGDQLVVSLQQPILGPYTLLVTFEEKPNATDGSFQAGPITPLDVQGDRGYIEVVSPFQVDLQTVLVSSQLLELDPLELPTEFRLLSTAPALGTWQYTQRPFELRLKAQWFDAGTTSSQVVEYSEANSRISPDGEWVTDLLYYVKSRGQRTLKVQMPDAPVRLWAVNVNGRPVTARLAGNATLIPLPGGTDPNEPIEVSLRLGKPASDQHQASVALPKVFAPVLKTQWSLDADENHVLLPIGGSVEPILSPHWPNGFDYLAGPGLLLFITLVVASIMGVLVRSPLPKLLILTVALAISVIGCWNAVTHSTPTSPLQLSLPVIASEEGVDMEVAIAPVWLASFSWPGVAMAILGIFLLFLGWQASGLLGRWPVRWVAMCLVLGGVLMQTNGVSLFFLLLAIFIAVYLYWPTLVEWCTVRKKAIEIQKPKKSDPTLESGNPSGIAVSSVLAFWIGSLLAATSCGAMWSDDPNAIEKNKQVHAPKTDNFIPANSIVQKWNISNRDKRLTASAEISLTGRPGDQFLLLRSPAVLTQFKGLGLRLEKVTWPDQTMGYFVTIPEVDKEPSENSQVLDNSLSTQNYTVLIEYQGDAIQPLSGVPVLTGRAALHQIDLTHDEVEWEVVCESAVRIEPRGSVQKPESKPMGVRLLLGTSETTIVLRPQTRDPSAEETRFYVEGMGLYTPGPGVIDGKHRLRFRASQGRIHKLSIVIPDEQTVSSVSGPISYWQFDADQNRLNLQLESNSPGEFTVEVETQRSLGSLPTSVQLTPLRVEKAEGEIGLIALAFGSDAQPENVQSDSLSLVNLGDFDSSLMKSPQVTLHRVYRYGAEAGTLSVQVIPVAPEVRVASKQVLSFGDERVLMGINFVTEVTRTGLFQLSFPLPDGFEVESLTSESMHHWSELSENGKRQIVLHLKGKTIGTHKFNLTLTGTVPSNAEQWSIPRFELNESTRQVGELVVQPLTGVRLRTLARQNVSEADPRALGAQGEGALAFRLLQRDWNLQLGIEKLAPWIVGQVLHEVTLREGQTRLNLFADFTVQNAAIRTMLVRLPKMEEDELKTVQASGESVIDFVRVSDEDNLWELRFKRRILGPLQFQIECERRGERDANQESLRPIEFPDTQQVSRFFAVRTGGRLELEPSILTQGWQASDWGSVPQSLREAGNRTTPAATLRAMSPASPLTLRVVRHSLADALKLRVLSGTLTSILSPTGDQLTSVDIHMEVIQRSTLSVQLPTGGELLSIFVNGESVHSVRQTGKKNTWQFYILPGIDDRTAQIRFVYSLTGDSLQRIHLVSPQLNVPLENIQWNVNVPMGFQLTHQNGNLELASQDKRATWDRQSYLSSLRGKQEDQARQATQLLEKAHQLLQSGEQSKARWALNNVANRNALDAASNEDARVQLENLQTQQAIVGLNTRRQRLYMDNHRGGAVIADNEQLRQAASANPILHQQQLNYRPQELSQLLAGNTKEDNAILQKIAGRLVQHQRTTDPVSQAILISLPEEGTIYHFRRSVQVAENAALELNLQFHSQYKLHAWQWAVLSALVLLLTAAIATSARRWNSSTRRDR